MEVHGVINLEAVEFFVLIQNYTKSGSKWLKDFFWFIGLWYWICLLKKIGIAENFYYNLLCGVIF